MPRLKIAPPHPSQIRCNQMFSIRAVMAAAGVLALSLSTALGEPQQLDGDAIAAVLSGSTVSGERGGAGWTQSFHPGGGTVYLVDGRPPLEGRWRVIDDRFCSLIPPAADWQCYELFRDRDVVVFLGDDGRQLPARLIGK